MANRNFSNGGKIYSMHVMPVIVTTTITIGATGAVTAIAGSMTASVTRLSTGTYRIKLQKSTNFPTLLAAQSTMVSPISGLSGISSVEVGNAPSASSALASGAELVIKTLSAAGALADPASGSQIKVLATYNNSSVKS